MELTRGQGYEGVPSSLPQIAYRSRREWKVRTRDKSPSVRDPALKRWQRGGRGKREGKGAVADMQPEEFPLHSGNRVVTALTTDVRWS